MTANFFFNISFTIDFFCGDGTEFMPLEKDSHTVQALNITVNFNGIFIVLCGFIANKQLVHWQFRICVLYTVINPENDDDTEFTQLLYQTVLP